jgi:N-acetyl-gamma-glutamylphosphate reductase
MLIFVGYGVGGHRHYPEIKQELALLAGESVGLTFVPHYCVNKWAMVIHRYMWAFDLNTNQFGKSNSLI